MTQQRRRVLLAWFVFSLILFFISISVLDIMLLFWSFFAGVAISIYIFRPSRELHNLLPSISVFKTKIKPQVLTSQKISNKCFVCGKANCVRQKPEKESENLQPWIGIEVTEEVNCAIEEFINILLERHVNKWYKNLSDDVEFITELKCSLRYCFAVIYRRLSKIDIADFILSEFLQISLNHVSLCLQALKKGYRKEDEILNFLSTSLHYCMRSRRHEVKYIRAMTDTILPFICPKSSSGSSVARSFIREVLASNVILPGIDAIDNPDWINKMLLLYFDDSPPIPAPGPPSRMVTFLQDIHKKPESTSNQSLLHANLEEILHKQEMLYQFMSFLKTHSAVHYLQFYLTVDDFNRRCLAPEQNEVQLKNLHNEAKIIYNTYCCPKTSSFIHFEQNIVDELYDISKGRWQEVNRLRTSTPLFRAFDHVYNVLETIYCPLFYEDDTYYKMMYGDRVPVTTNQTYPSASSNINRMNNKKSLKRTNNRKSISENTFAEKSDFFLDTNSLDDEEFDKTFLDDDVIHVTSSLNLSMWRVSIPSIRPRHQGDGFFFMIEVINLNKKESDEVDKWTVLRHHNEFYALEKQLTEFHGSLTPISLPPKKIFLRNFEYLNSKRLEFEKFLQGLITSPSLHKSELLYNFLIPERVGTVSRFNTSSLPSVKLSNFIRRVPNKLIKEKGRHIDAFLVSLISSCEAVKPKPGKTETLKNAELIMNRKIENHQFPDGDFCYKPVKNTRSNQQQDRNILTCLIVFCVQLFNIDQWVLQALIILKLLFRRTIEPLISWQLKKKLEIYKQEHHVVRIIHLLRDVIFHDNEPRRYLVYS